VCHSYDIAYKFHYTCLSCGYIYGRHSKSIDTDTAGCGRAGCGGRLELRLPGAAAAGGAGSGAAAGAAAPVATARNPSGPRASRAAQRREVVARTPLMTPERVMREVAAAWPARKAGAAAATTTATASSMTTDMEALVAGMASLGVAATARTAAEVVVIDDDDSAAGSDAADD